MMADFTWIKISFFLIPVFQITAAVTGPLFFTVRDGDEVTLPCGNVINDQHKCDSTTWLFSGSGNAEPLFERGRIHKNANATSDRLDVTENCSVVIKKVTVEEVGYYTCRQFTESGQWQVSQVHLSVVTMTEQKDNKKVTFNCTVSTNEPCAYTVEWVYVSKGVDKNYKTTKTSSTCSASVTTAIDKSKNYKVLTCKARNIYTGKEHLFTFKRQSSRKKTGGEDTKVTTTTSPTMRMTEKSGTVGTNKTESANNDTAKKSQGWWWYILVAVGLAAFLIVVAAVVRRRRTKAYKTQMDDNIADPEDGVSYASISYTKKTDSKARVQVGDEAVIYSTVRVPSSSAGASADPSDLYATIN